MMKPLRYELPILFRYLKFKTGAEIGVAAGDFSDALCSQIPGLKLYCVDPWRAYKGNRRGGTSDKHQRNFERTTQRLAKYDVTYLRMFSMEAVEHIPDSSLDFVFIDGNHDYSYVKEDLERWSEKVKVGGIIAGHDYYHFRHSGVIEAVDEFVAKKGYDLQLTEVDPISPDDKQPSFYFFKK